MPTMTSEQQILDAIGAGESRDWEFKSAKGGLPGSLWETYSAMANTDGGTIVLGVGEQNGIFSLDGLDKPDQIHRNFWNIVNDRGKVSINLLTDADVRPVVSGGKTVLVIQVPRAARRQRPVFIGLNPLVGTYRRNNEGDYHCTEDEVGRMLADRSEESADSRILERFSLADLDPDSLRQFRNRFSARTPAHPWLALDEKSLLEKLGGWRQDRQSGADGLTVAGLLMFGKDESIRDPAALPQYHIDYREHLTDDPQVRWTDRLTIDGTWVGNVFQFYQKVVVRLLADLKLPFQMGPDLFRRDDTIVHEAVREAFVNALIHADYRGQGGVVIEKFRERFEFSNPGSLLLSFEQVVRGGVSECRNKSLQLMFQMIGGGEKAGSGIDKIRQGWASQKWRVPTIQSTTQPDRVRLILSLVSVLPEERLAQLKTLFGRRFEGLGPLEVQSLVTALQEGSVSNSRMRLESDEHATDLTKMLQGLVAKGFLDQRGQKRGTFYVLGKPTDASADSSHSEASSSHKGASFPHSDGSSLHKSEPPADAGVAGAEPAPGTTPAVRDSLHTSVATLALFPDSLHTADQFSAEDWDRLRLISKPALDNDRLTLEQTRTIILELCQGRLLTAIQLGDLMNRNPDSLRNRFLSRMVEEELLLRRFPNEPNRPDQAYTTRPATIRTTDLAR